MVKGQVGLPDGIWQRGMRGVYWCLCLWVLAACSESRETRLQRYLAQGNDMVKKLNSEQAERYFKEALKLDSCFADAWNNLGTLYFSQRKYELALAQYDHAVACRPAYVDSYFNRANARYELKEYYAALEDAEAIRKMKPDTSAVYFLEGLVFTKLRTFDKAVSSFEAAQLRDAKNGEILVNLGTVRYYQRDFEGARRDLSKAIALSVGQSFEDKVSLGNAYNALAMIDVEEGDLAGARQHVEKALAYVPDDAYFLNNRGYLSLLEGDFETAREDINKSITTDPYNGWAYRNKGLLFFKLNHYDDAIRLLLHAESMDPFIDKLYGYLGDAYDAQGDHSRACTYYRKALERKEIDPQTVSRKRCTVN